MRVTDPDGSAEWMEVEDFSRSGPTDRHFVWDSASGEVRFGPRIRYADGTVRQHGAIPRDGAEIAVTSDGVSCAYNVQGGLLSLGEGGTLAISQIGREHPELRVLVDGYLARLGGGVLYGLQRRAHVAVSRRFFRHLLAEAARR